MDDYIDFLMTLDRIRLLISVIAAPSNFIVPQFHCPSKSYAPPQLFHPGRRDSPTDSGRRLSAYISMAHLHDVFGEGRARCQARV